VSGYFSRLGAFGTSGAVIGIVIGMNDEYDGRDGRPESPVSPHDSSGFVVSGC
jgi:hypothetical protein